MRNTEVDRKFIDWDYTSESGKKHRIEVRYKQPREGAEFRITFYVRYVDPTTGMSISIDDPNLEQLRKRLIDALEDQNRITWLPMLLVTAGEADGDLDGLLFRRDYPRRRDAPRTIDAGLTLHVYAFEQGSTTDGRKFWRCDRSGGKQRDDKPHAWAISEGEFWNDRDRTVSQETNALGVVLIPDSPEAREKLRMFAAAIDDLRTKVATFLNSKGALARLLKASSLPGIAE